MRLFVVKETLDIREAQVAVPPNATRTRLKWSWRNEPTMNRRPPPISGTNKIATKDVSVVLAHGAWADGSSWARVIAALEADAVKVFAAPLPLTHLADDVAEPHPQAPKLVPDGNILIWLPEGAFETAFAQNGSAQDRAVLAAVRSFDRTEGLIVSAGHAYAGAVIALAAADIAELHCCSTRAPVTWRSA